MCINVLSIFTKKNINFINTGYIQNYSCETLEIYFFSFGTVCELGKIRIYKKGKSNLNEMVILRKADKTSPLFVFTFKLRNASQKEGLKIKLT